jgi:hypothetical protein
MVSSVELASLLKDTAAKIRAWRAQVEQLRLLVDAARITGGVSESLLVSVEETAGSIHDEIATYAEITRNVASTSLAAASDLAPGSDALHLVLLEVTELSTQLYAARSQLGRIEEPLLAAPTS